MATTTTNFGWDIPQSTDLVKDGATAIATLGQDIDTALVDLKGGTSGQVLSKNSNTDLDFTWVTQDDANAIQNTIIDAKGDLIVGTAADTPARLAVGTNGQYLTADSTTASGLKWNAAPAGAVKQIVQTQWTAEQSLSSTTYADVTSGSLSITPTSSSSSILVIGNIYGFIARDFAGISLKMKLLRGTTSLVDSPEGVIYIYAQNVSQSGIFAAPYTMIYKDSPATTSSITYKFQAAISTTANGGYGLINKSTGSISSITLMEI